MTDNQQYARHWSHENDRVASVAASILDCPKRVSVLDQCFYLHACVGYGLFLHFRIRPDVVAECYIRAFLDLFCCHLDTVAVTPVLASLLDRKAKQQVHQKVTSNKQGILSGL